MKPTTILTGLAPLLAAALFGLTTSSATGASYGYTNSASVTPTSGSVLTSTIEVSGQPTTGVTDVNIGLNLYLNSYPQDSDILLEGPTGVRVMLLSDAGGKDDVQGLQIQVDDAASGTVPEDGPLASGAYQPTNVFDGDGDDDLVPAPTANALSAFNGLDPNGTWTLYVSDDASGDMGGVAGGWTLNIDPAATCAGLGVTIMGTTGDDRIVGTDQPDVIAALAGNDTVYGLEGGDIVCGGAGDDFLRGSFGKDRLKGGAGTDVCYGGRGVNTLTGCETSIGGS